jgi:HSP20 family protein
MLDIEQAIREVGTIYQALTGRPIEAGQTDLPKEIDAHAHIEDRYRQLRTMLESPAPGAAGAPFVPAWTPPLEVIEHEAEVRFEIDLPAVGRDQIGIEVLGDCLRVRGRRVAPAPSATPATVRYSERSGGPFQRVIPLPARARHDGIQASLRDGVLAVTVPTDGPGGAARTVEIR